MTVTFNEKSRVLFTRSKGHFYLNIQIVCEGSADRDDIEFIYDTAAFITTVNKQVYQDYGLDRLPRIETSIKSYSGSTKGYIFQIPGIVIGERFLVGVWAFAPKSDDIRQNLLGSNVIEYFRPLQDNQNNCFYFADNPAPKPYTSPDKSFTLACDKVMFVEQYIKGE
ncbi:MAG: hypothetical protein FWB74_06870 [Defluviitaleaceae bacterium]|nr:hypothetical protein [Defluviitaleaceae bacterium]